MTTATVLLNLALGAGASGLVATAMTVVPYLDRLRVAGRTHTARQVRSPQGRLGVTAQRGA